MMGDESKKLAIHSIEFSCSSPKQFLMYFVIAVANANRWKMADIVAIEPSFETVDARLSAAQSRTQVDY